MGHSTTLAPFRPGSMDSKSHQIQRSTLFPLSTKSYSTIALLHRRRTHSAPSILHKRPSSRGRRPSHASGGISFYELPMTSQEGKKSCDTIASRRLECQMHSLPSNTK